MSPVLNPDGTLHKDTRKLVESAGEEVLSTGLLRCMGDIQALLDEYWGGGMGDAARPSGLRQRFEECVTLEGLEGGETNPLVAPIPSKLGDVLFDGIESLRKLEMKVRLCVPPIEDGNNFGVEIQGAVLKAIVRARSTFSYYQEKLTDYFWKRGGAVEKFLVQLSKETVVAGGEAGAAKESVKTSKPVRDYREYVICHDIRYFLYFRQIALEVHDTILQVLDAHEKNLDKVRNPKGEGHARHSMY